jgi:hypothetical protein
MMPEATADAVADDAAALRLTKPPATAPPAAADEPPKLMPPDPATGAAAEGAPPSEIEPATAVAANTPISNTRTSRAAPAARNCTIGPAAAPDAFWPASEVCATGQLAEKLAAPTAIVMLAAVTGDARAAPIR